MVKNYVKANKKWWDSVTQIHSSSKLYDLSKFKKGTTSLQPLEINEVGDVKGKTLLHLMCHFGMDTLSWARKGAIVTGVDLSSDSIALAKKLSIEIRTPATFICKDIYELPKVLNQKFDIIFMSYGVLLWLSDIEEWAKIINHFLKKGGVLYIVELHPFTNMFDSEFKLSYQYFDKGPFTDDSPGTYTDWNADIKGTTHQWGHTLGDVINSLINEGLKIEFLHEFSYTMYDQFPGFMKKNKKGQYVLRDKKIQIPLLFSLKATK